jgi:hypothetical protein
MKIPLVGAQKQDLSIPQTSQIIQQAKHISLILVQYFEEHDGITMHN